MKQVFALPKVALSIISLVFRGCGMAATADSLRCIEKAVFEDGWISLEGAGRSAERQYQR